MQKVVFSMIEIDKKHRPYAEAARTAAAMPPEMDFAEKVVKTKKQERAIKARNTRNRIFKA